MDNTMDTSSADIEGLDVAISELDDIYTTLKSLQSVRKAQTTEETEIDEGIGTAERKHWIPSTKSGEQLKRNISQVEVVTFDESGEIRQTVTEEKQKNMRIPPFPTHLNDFPNYERSDISHSRGGFARSADITFPLPPHELTPTPKPRRNPFVQFDSGSDSDYDEVPADNKFNVQGADEPTYTPMRSPEESIPDYEEVPDKLDDLNYPTNNTVPYRHNPHSSEVNYPSLSYSPRSPQYGVVNFESKRAQRNDIKPPVVLQMNHSNTNNGIPNESFIEETEFGSKVRENVRADMTSDDEWDDISVSNNETEDHTSAQYRDPNQPTPTQYIHRNSMDFDPVGDDYTTSKGKTCCRCDLCCRVFMALMVVVCVALFLAVTIFYVYIGVENEKYLAVANMQNGLNNGG